MKKKKKISIKNNNSQVKNNFKKKEILIAKVKAKDIILAIIVLFVIAGATWIVYQYYVDPFRFPRPYVRSDIPNTIKLGNLYIEAIEPSIAKSLFENHSYNMQNVDDFIKVISNNENMHYYSNYDLAKSSIIEEHILLKKYNYNFTKVPIQLFREKVLGTYFGTNQTNTIFNSTTKITATNWMEAKLNTSQEEMVLIFSDNIGRYLAIAVPDSNKVINDCFLKLNEGKNLSEIEIEFLDAEILTMPNVILSSFNIQLQAKLSTGFLSYFYDILVNFKEINQIMRDQLINRLNQQIHHSVSVHPLWFAISLRDYSLIAYMHNHNRGDHLSREDKGIADSQNIPVIALVYNHSDNTITPEYYYQGQDKNFAAFKLEKDIRNVYDSNEQFRHSELYCQFSEPVVIIDKNIQFNIYLNCLSENFLQSFTVLAFSENEYVIVKQIPLNGKKEWKNEINLNLPQKIKGNPYDLILLTMDNSGFMNLYHIGFQ